MADGGHTLQHASERFFNGGSAIDRDGNEHVIRAKLQFSNKGWGWNETRMSLPEINLWFRGGWCSSTFRCNDHSCYFKSCGDRVEMRLYPREYKSRRINWNKHLKRTVWRFVQLISLLIESLYQIALVPADCPRGNDGTNESGDSNSITKFLSTCIQRVQRHERHMRPVFETDSNCWNMRADIYVVTYVFYLVEGGRGETRGKGIITAV